MVETTIIKTRRDSTANWEAYNIALAEGEIGIEVLTNGWKKLKIGDGTTPWNDLKYVTETPLEIKEDIDEKVEALQTIIQEALDTKANIYIRQAQGITYGNNIQGMHIIVPDDFTYTTDWERSTDDDQHFIRTDNDFKYVDSQGTETYIIQNGQILIEDSVITNPFIISTMTGSFNDEDFFYRYFDIKDLDQKIGLVSSLLTADKSNVVNAINSLKHYVDSVVSSTEVANSPYSSYADFLADAGATIQPGKYAYVTFLSTDNRPTGGNWNKITADETWRLDCSSVARSPITNMTASMSANVVDEVATDSLKPAGNDLIVNWLQSFRNNLKSLFASIKDKLDKKTTNGDYVYIHNGTTQNEKPYTIAPNAGTIAERTSAGTLRGATAVQDTDLVNLGQLNNKAVQKQPTITLTNPTQAQIDALGKYLTGDLIINFTELLTDARNLFGFVGENVTIVINLGGLVHTAGSLIIADCKCIIQLNNGTMGDIQVRRSSYLALRTGANANTFLVYGCNICVIEGGASVVSLTVKFGSNVNILGTIGTLVDACGKVVFNTGSVLTNDYTGSAPIIDLRTNYPQETYQRKFKYSTAEVDTGLKRTDGKPIYRRNFTGNITAAADEQVITVLLGAGIVSDIVDSGGWILTNNNNKASFPMISFNTTFISNLSINANGELVMGSKYINARTDNPYNIWVEYTKN